MSLDQTPTGAERTTPYQGPRPTPSLAVGEPFGRFIVRDKLGEGSFGRVYRAYDPSLDREVALKVPIFPADQPDLAERFLREARSAARLRHPNIVAVFETGKIDGKLYIATEFVAGQTLAQAVATERPSLRRAVEWVRSLALAMHYAHEEGVVHRDVKPSNIMIDTRGRAQLMDFGLAKRFEPDGPIPIVDDSDDDTRTAAGTVLGTPGYMAPEQARGELESVGPHSDQYSLGVVLFELLAGRRPFIGSFAQLRLLVGEPKLEAESPRTYNPEIPPPLAAVCLKAITKLPNRRYGTLADFAIDLQHWLNNEPVAAQRKRPSARSGSRRGLGSQLWGRKGRAGEAALALALVLLVVGCWLLMASSQEHRQQASRLSSELRDWELRYDILWEQYRSGKLGRDPRETEDLMAKLFAASDRRQQLRNHLEARAVPTADAKSTTGAAIAFAAAALLGAGGTLLWQRRKRPAATG